MATMQNRFEALAGSDDEADVVASGRNHLGGRSVRHHAPRGAHKGRERQFDRISGTGRDKSVPKGGAGRGNWGSDAGTLRAAEAAGSASEAVARAARLEGLASADSGAGGAAAAEGDDAAEEEVDNSITFEKYLATRKRDGEAFEELEAATIDTSKGAYAKVSFVDKSSLSSFENPAAVIAGDDAPVRKGRRDRRRVAAGDDIAAGLDGAILGFVTDASDLPYERREHFVPRDGADRRGGRGGARGGAAGGAGRGRGGDRPDRAGGRGGDRRGGRGGSRGGGRGGRTPAFTDDGLGEFTEVGKRRGGERRGGRGGGRGGTRGGRGGRDREGGEASRDGSRGGGRVGSSRGRGGAARGGSRGGGRGGGRGGVAAAPTSFPGLGAIGKR